MIAAADKASAEAQLEMTRRGRVKSLFKSPAGGNLSDEEVDQILDSPRARAVDEMLTYSAVGTGEEAAAYLADFQAKTGVDELITVHYADSVDNRVRSVEILAEAGQARRTGRRVARSQLAVLVTDTCERTQGRRATASAKESRTTVAPVSSSSGWEVRKATTGMPAARADSMPLGASSSARQRAGSTPSAAGAEQERFRVGLAAG